MEQGKINSELWGKHVTKSVQTSQEAKATILWNQQVEIVRTIPNNKLNI
jgi:hypothetical protein